MISNAHPHVTYLRIFRTLNILVLAVLCHLICIGVREGVRVRDAG